MNDFDKDIAEKDQVLREQGYSFVEMANMLNVSERQIQNMTVKNSTVVKLKKSDVIKNTSKKLVLFKSM